MEGAPGSSLLHILQRAWLGPCREPLLDDPEVADASSSGSESPRLATRAPASATAATGVPPMTASTDPPLGRRSPFGRSTLSFNYTPDSSQHAKRKDTGDPWMTEEHFTQDFATAVDIAAEEAGLEGADMSNHGGSTFGGRQGWWRSAGAASAAGRRRRQLAAGAPPAHRTNQPHGPHPATSHNTHQKLACLPPSAPPTR